MLEVIPMPGTDYSNLEQLLKAWNSNQMFFVVNRNQEINAVKAKTYKVPGGKLKFIYNNYQDTYEMDLGKEFDNESQY